MAYEGKLTIEKDELLKKVQIEVDKLIEEDHQVVIEYDDPNEENLTCMRYSNIVGVYK